MNIKAVHWNFITHDTSEYDQINSTGSTLNPIQEQKMVRSNLKLNTN